MNDQAAAVMVVDIGLIAVDGQNRHKADQLKALPQDIGKGNIICPVIVGVEGQNTSGQRVHHVPAGGFHDDIPDKTGGQRTITPQEFGKMLQLLR